MKNKHNHSELSTSGAHAFVIGTTTLIWIMLGYVIYFTAAMLPIDGLFGITFPAYNLHFPHRKIALSGFLITCASMSIHWAWSIFMQKYTRISLLHLYRIQMTVGDKTKQKPSKQKPSHVGY